jgi:two-component system, cell cycle sensor histidine kinase and response regulator CckA
VANENERLRQEVAELKAENVRLTEALHQSEEWFRKIFHASSNMMAIHTIKERRFVDLNEAAASLGGFKREELIGHTMEERELVEDPNFEDKVERKLKEEGRAHNIETKMRTKNGEWRTVLVSVDPIIANNEACMLAVSVDITEREEKADALRRSEEKYRMLVENSLQGLAIIQNSRYVFCNSTFAAISGYTLEELAALSPNEISEKIHPGDRDFIHRHYSDQLQGKPVDPRFEYRGFKKHGIEIWLEAHSSIIEYHGMPAIQFVCMDITDRKNAENALRESEERFRLIADTIDEVFWIFDTGKRSLTYLSPAFERIWGFSRKDVLNKQEPFIDTIHPDDRDRVIAADRLMETGQPIDYEFRIIRSNRSVRTIWNRGFPVPGKSGGARQYVGVSQDVTEKRLAEEGLKESKEYLNQIINCIGDPIFVKDSEHRIMLVNDAMCAFRAAQREEVVGRIDMPVAVPMPFWEQEEEVLKSGKEIISEDTIIDGHGVPRTLMSKKSLLTDKGGNRQVVGVLRDITEYKRLEAQFLQSQKMEAVGVLAGGVAHDFNNLLNVINGYAELILEDIDPDDPIREEIEQIREAGQRATSLTSQLLAFGRKQIMQPEIFDLNQVIANMSSMLRRMIGEDIEVVSNIPQDPMLINADPGKIQQVVMNLVVNARDAMPNGGKLTIETATADLDKNYVRDHPMTKPGPYVMMAISDNGIGMDTETQARIFEPFFTTKAKGKGTGLGMSTVYGIVKQSDGFIWVYSEPGKGTTVKIYFPRETRAVVENSPETQIDPILHGSETVLIVEDEMAVRSLASRILANYGYNVLEAEDGMEALRLARNSAQEIHLVITDVVMPGIGGKVLLSRIEDVLPDVKSLFISGYTDSAIVHHGILDSGIAFLQKPFTVEGLLRKVREVLNS